MKYPVKVWLLTVVAAPFVFLITMLLYNKGSISNIASGFPIIFLMILFGTLFSLPSLFLFWLLSDELNELEMSQWARKLTLCVVGILFVWITFFIINRNLFSDWNFNDYIWPVVYSFVLTIFTVLLRMPESVTEQQEFNES